MFKKMLASAKKPEPKVYETKRFIVRKRKPLSFSYQTTNNLPSLDTGYVGYKIEDRSLTQAKELIKHRSVQLYNKGPYGLLTDSLAQEMRDGQNRRRS